DQGETVSGGHDPIQDARKAAAHILLRSQRLERLYRRSLRRPAVAFALGIALQHPSRPFENDRFRISAIAATAVISRQSIVAEADDRSVANRTGLNRRHRSALPPASLRACASACASVAKALLVPITA